MTRMTVAAGIRITFITAALLLLMAAGCGTFGSIAEPPAGQVLADSVGYLSRAATYTVDGTVTEGSTTYTVAMDVKGVDGQGSLLVNGNQIDAVKAKGSYLIRSYPYLRTVSPNADYIGNDWVLWSSNDISRMLDQLTEPAVLSAALAPEAPSLKRSPDLLFGSDAVKLQNDVVTLWVSADQPTRLLRIETRSDHQLGYLKDVRINFSKINEPVAIEPVTVWVDPANWDTMRPFFKVQGDSYEYQSCDSGGCGIAVNVKNFGGTRGSASFSFAFAKDGGGDLGSCGGAIPATSNGAESKIGCRIETDEWKEYYKSGTQTGYGATIKITSDQ